MPNDLTLEKMEIKKRLEAVETNIGTMIKQVGSLQVTAQKMNDVLAVVDKLSWGLTKIFAALCTAIVIGVAPILFKFIGEVLSKHGG